MNISYLFLNYLILFRSVVGFPVSEGVRGYMDFPVAEGGALFLSPVEQEIVSEINLLRSDPAGYARKYLEPLAGSYRGSMLYIPGQSPVRTREGLVALRDAIRCLKISAPAPPLNSQSEPDSGIAGSAERSGQVWWNRSYRYRRFISSGQDQEIRQNK